MSSVLRFFFIFLFTVIAISSFAQNNFLIKGKTNDRFNNKTIYLEINQNDIRLAPIFKDSTVISLGSFSFSGQLNQPSSNALLRIKGEKSSNASFALDTGNNFLSLRFDINNLKASSYLKIYSNTTSHRIKQEIDSMQNLAYANYRKSISKPEGVVFLPYKLSLNESLDEIETLSKYPNNYYSLIALYQVSLRIQMLDKKEEVLVAFNKLNDDIKKCEFGKKISMEWEKSLEIQNSVKIGKKVPSFSVKNNYGKLINNKELEGKPYLIAFSATWCLPCLEIQPKLLAIYNEYKSKGFNVIYFNLDANVPKWNDQILKRKLNWINVSERTKPIDSKIAKLFNINALPTYILVDKNGTIIYNTDEVKDDNKSVYDLIKKLFI